MEKKCTWNGNAGEPAFNAAFDFLHRWPHHPEIRRRPQPPCVCMRIYNRTCQQQTQSVLHRLCEQFGSLHKAQQPASLESFFHQVPQQQFRDADAVCSFVHTLDLLPGVFKAGHVQRKSPAEAPGPLPEQAPAARLSRNSLTQALESDPSDENCATVGPFLNIGSKCCRARSLLTSMWPYLSLAGPELSMHTTP